MRIWIWILFAALAACTKPNPNTCCVTDAQCAELGVDERRPCAAGQACSGLTCVAAECESSLECTSPESPICLHNLCVGSCTIDAECADVPDRPYCAAGGSCVGCTEAAQCPASAAICDEGTSSCRGCERDDECPSGVCIEADGVCAEASTILYVSSDGADTGECGADAACLSLPYAVQKATAIRNVIRVIGGSVQVETSTLAIKKSIVIDGSGVVLHKTPNVPTLALEFAGQVTVQGIVIEGISSGTDPSITVGIQSTLRLAGGTEVRGGIQAANGGINMQDVVVKGPVLCSSGTVTTYRVEVVGGVIETNSCQVSVKRSRFDRDDGAMLRLSGGSVTVENSLFVQQHEYADSIQITAVAPGSVFRFNTVVNTSGIDSDGQALFCDDSLSVTSNIFAYASAHPMGFPSGDYCASVRHSLFDEVAIPEHTVGDGTNIVADPSSFFVSRAARDFHLAPDSPAMDAAEVGLPVDEDYEGRPRTGAPDMGAFSGP